MAAPRKYLVIGGGAVGSIFGWRLQQGGANVSVVCRGNYAAVKEKGYDINSVKFGKNTFVPNHVYPTALHAIKDKQTYDFVLVCTKALPNITNPAEIIAPAITDKSTAMVLLQNGIGIEKYYADMFPENPLLSTSVYIDTFQSDHGLIDHGSTSRLEFGLYETTKSDKVLGQEKLHQLDKDLLAGGAGSEIAANIQRTRWTKIIWNASFNPISVVSGGNNSRELLRNPLSNELLRNSMREIIALGEAVTGIKVSDVPADDYITGIFQFTDNRPNPVVPSMLVDYINKRPMEHQVILKNPIELAKKHGVNVPILETVYASLVMLEKKNLA